MAGGLVWFLTTWAPPEWLLASSKPVKESVSKDEISALWGLMGKGHPISFASMPAHIEEEGGTRELEGGDTWGPSERLPSIGMEIEMIGV